MKQFIKALLVAGLSIVVAFSSLVFASAENNAETSTRSITIIDSESGSRAYELVWKYKESQGHVYKRRWNMTLGCWYDPEWILVY